MGAPNQLGVDTDLLRAEAFRPYQDHVKGLVDRLVEVPTVPEVVPHQEGELDDSVVPLMQKAIIAINGLMELMPDLTEGDGRNVELFGKLATAGEDDNVTSTATTFVA
jgi:hypothetical protein